MKKMVLITFVLLLGFFVGSSYAIEVTLFGPTQYLRTTGKPNVYGDTFPGLAGQGSLILKNGDANGKNRVSSAIILVNGKQVLGPNAFNQHVYNIEVPLNLTGNNSISVQLQSKPGSYLTVQVIQEVHADAAAVIGSSGGTIIANNGIQAFIPQGATDNSVVVAISYVSPDQLRIDSSEGLGLLGAVNFNIGDTVLKINAELTIPKPSNFSAGSQIYLGKIIPLSEKDLIAMVDTASVQGNLITTNNPAIYGVLSSGTFSFYTNNTVCGVPDYQNFFAGKINPTCTDKLYMRIYLLTQERILLAQEQNLWNYINGALTFNDAVQSVISVADTIATLNGLAGKSVEELITDSAGEMSGAMATLYGGYWDIGALWLPLITCPIMGSCAQELAVTVAETWFNAWAATQVIYLEEEMNNNLIAMAFFDRYYSYGRNQTLVAQSLGLAPDADMDSIVKEVAKTVVNDPWWWPFPSYDVTKIKNIITTGEQWVESIYKALAPRPIIISSLQILPAEPYGTFVGEFKIENRGAIPITLDVLTIGGRDPDGHVLDFPWDRNVTLEPFSFRQYVNVLTLSKAGTYHFFTAYRTLDGQWNTSIPTEKGVSNTLDITVSAPAPVLSSITITPAIAALTVGNTQQFTATAFDQFNNPMVPQPTFTWASSNTTIGTINAAGLFSALSPGGPINVTASVDSVSGSASVTVSAPAPILTSIGVNPATATVTLGSTQQFTATALDQYGNPIIPQPSFIWTSSNTSIGTVETTGLFTGVSVGGPITITASVGPISGSASVTVIALPPPPQAGIIAFTSNRDGTGDIYVMNADGSNQVRLTFDNARVENPTWSPDGTKIAFHSWRDGNSEIYVMSPDGSNLTRLTFHPAYDHMPAWSPDGSRIAFTSRRDGNDEIYVMNSDGTGLTRITNHYAEDRGPVWSPDGTKLAFYTDRDDRCCWEIYVMDADGTNQTRLTYDPASAYCPAWSPDGSRIVFTSNRDGNWEVYVMNTDGTNQARLTNNNASEDYPVWSPDGSMIAFTSGRDGNGEIYTMNADGSGQTNLTNNPAGGSFPSWTFPSPPLEASPWPMFQHDAQHTGRSQHIGPKNAKLSWAHDLASIIGNWGLASFQPVIASDRTVYLGVGELATQYSPPGLSWGKLYALNPEGTPKWESPDLGSPPLTPAIGSDGTIYVPTYNKGVYALNPNGTPKWSFYEEEMGPIWAITIGEDGKLYFTSDQQLYSLNADGSKNWVYCCGPRGGSSGGGPAIGTDGTIYVVWPGFISGTDAGRGMLSAFSSDGISKWGMQLEFSATAPAIGPDGTIYVVVGLPGQGYGWRLHAFSQNGQRLWQTTTAGPGYPAVSPVIDTSGKIIVAANWSQPCQDNPIWTCSASGLWVFTPNGDLFWTLGPHGGQTSNNTRLTQPIVDSQGTIFVAENVYNLLTVRLYSISDTGEVNWSLDVPGETISSPALGAYGHIYIGVKAPQESGFSIKLYAIGEN